MSRKEETFKKSLSLIDNVELQRIDNHYNEIADEFLKQYVKEKDMVVAQLVMMNLRKENRELKEENQELKDRLNTYENPEDLTLMFVYCDEKAKDKIKCLEQENQQLKEELKQKDDIINKAIEFINKYNGSTWYQISISIISELLELLDNKGKDI